MNNLLKSFRRQSRSVFAFFCLAVCLALVATPMNQLRTRAQSQSKEQAETPGEVGHVPAAGNTSGLSRGGRNAPVANRPELVGTDQGVESEPNNTFGTADVLTGAEGKIKGNNFSGGLPAAAGTDEDWYSFTTTVPSSKVYAAVIDSSASQQDSVLEVVNIGGAPVLELDDQDGTFGGSSSSIAGTVLAAPGTYYLRVTNFSASAPIAPYDLYFAVRSGLPTAETEPNNNGTPQVLPASQYVSGVIDPLADSDTFTFTATAGDTVFLSLDLDPERDVTTFNGRVGLGVFGTPGQLLVTGDAGTFDTIDSEAMVMTVDATGTYTVYVDSQVATAGATQTYNLNVTTIPAAAAGTCTTYTNAVSTAIPDLALTTSTIVIPDSKIIRSLRAIVDITHPNFPDLDVHLRSPATSNNDNGLFTDIGLSTQTGAQNINLMDEAALPPLFTNNNGMIYKPEALYRLDWFKGENSLGTWSLDIRDDSTTVATPGTLNSWSLEVCEEPAPTGNLIYSQDFEASNGFYTHTGTADEWEYGTPATVGTTTANPVAAFLNCASGTNCWKTDLDNTYEISSIQDLTSLGITLPAGPGATTLSWQARYQMESVSFDRIWVRVTQVGVPANTRLVWHANNQTMVDSVGSPAVNIPASAGWGRYSADISDFAGMSIQVTFHLESDTSINFSGWAIDDVQIRTSNPSAANGTVSGRITDPNGVPIAGAVVNLSGTQNRKFITDANGDYRFAEVETNGFYSVTPSMVNYHFSPEVRSFSQIGNQTEAAFTATRDSVMGVNRIDTPEYFVRQHYLDFLGREPDESGFNFWSDQMLECGNDATCLERRTINVSAAYFLSIEFMETGGLVDGLYRASYDRRPLFSEFMPDTRTVAQNVVVGNAGWAQTLAANKQAFLDAWVQRPAFRAAYDGLANESYVDTLISHTGVSFTSSERDALVSSLNNQTATRADVLREVAENGQFVSAKHNETFVMMQYFGYLRRNPDDSGFHFWLNKLNEFEGNFEQAEMVKAFLVSGEYRERFRQ